MTSFFNRAKTLSSLAFSASIAFAATPTVEIGTWGNFAKGAISHTFDDNTNGQLDIAVPAFEKVGLRMTMFVITGQSNARWSDYKTAAANGHEVGSHAVTHPSSGAMKASDFQPSQQTIQQKVSAQCVSLAFPNCDIVTGAKQYYIASRTCYKGNGTSEASPANWETIDSKMFGTCSGCANDANTMNTFASDAAKDNKWAVTCHHGLEGDNHGWANTNVAALKSHLDYLDKNRSTIWCETFGNVARYIKERDAAKATVTSSDDNTIKLTLTDNLADSIYNYPLSLRCETPSGWTTPTVTQNGKAVKDTVVTVNSKSYIMFQAVPDGGEIVLSATPTSTIEQVKLYATGKMVLIDKNTLSVNSRQFSGSNIAVSLFDLRGKTIAKYSLNNSESSIALPSKKLRNEAFFVKVSDGRKTYTEKVTPQM